MQDRYIVEFLEPAGARKGQYVVLEGATEKDHFELFEMIATAAGCIDTTLFKGLRTIRITRLNAADGTFSDITGDALSDYLIWTDENK